VNSKKDKESEEERTKHGNWDNIERLLRRKLRCCLLHFLYGDNQNVQKKQVRGLFSEVFPYHHTHTHRVCALCYQKYNAVQSFFNVLNESLKFYHG